MNSPVTHAECQTHMKELEDTFHKCLVEDKEEFRETVREIKEWVVRVESKFDMLIKEVGVIGIGALISFLWGKV